MAKELLKDPKGKRIYIGTSKLDSWKPKKAGVKGDHQLRVIVAKLLIAENGFFTESMYALRCEAMNVRGANRDDRSCSANETHQVPRYLESSGYLESFAAER